MRKLSINFIYQIWKIWWCFIVNVLKKHYSCKIIRKIFCLFLWNLSLNYFHNLLFMSRFNFFSKMNHFFFKIQKPFNIFPCFRNFERKISNNFSTNFLNLSIWLCSNIINKIPNSKFSTFRYNIQNMFTLYKITIFYSPQYRSLTFTRNKFLILILFIRLLKQKNTIIHN